MRMRSVTADLFQDEEQKAEVALVGQALLLQPTPALAQQLRQVVAWAEPATESAMETRLRMCLVLAGLPRPQVQVPLHDDHGRFLGRADLYYPERTCARIRAMFAIAA